MIVRLIFIGAFALSAAAQPAPRETVPITLDQAIRLALQNNFDVQIETLTPQIFRYDLAGAYGVYEPSFNFTYEHEFNSVPAGALDEFGRPISAERESDAFAGNIGPGLTGYLPTGLRYQFTTFVNRSRFSGVEQFRGGAFINLRQPLLRDFWTDAPRTQIALGKRNLKISEWGYRRQVMQTLTAVEQAYHNLIFTRESVKVQESALELAEQLVRENRKRVEVGALAPLDEKQAEAQFATSRAQLIEAQRLADLQENTLKNLITRDFMDWHQVRLEPTEKLLPIPEAFDLPGSWRRAMALRPELQQSRLDLENLDITLRFHRNQLFPALDLVGSYGHNSLNTESYGRALRDLPPGDNPRYSYGVVLSVPLGNISARNRHRATQTQRQQALLRYKQIEQNIIVEIDDAVSIAQSAFQRVRATRQAREFAETALDAEQRKLEAGTTTSFFVLQFQREATAARFEEIRALAEYNNALAQLAFSEGTTLERHRVDLNLGIDQNRDLNRGAGLDRNGPPPLE